MAKAQEFYVTLRLVTNPQADNGKPLTEERVRLILKKALQPDAMDERIQQIKFGDVIDVTKYMTAVQGILCDLGVKDRISFTLGDITELLRMCRDIPA